MVLPPKLLAVVLCVFVPLLSSCSSEPTQPLPRFSDEQLRKGCTAQAEEADRQPVDGWYFGQEPRVFKSGYGRAKAEQKADFAMAFHNKVLESGQNLAEKWSSYWPYSKRALFARTWWSNPANDIEFAKQDPKYKVLWIHEALLDASELWWRAYENLARDRVGAPDVLAHDAEQKMVFDYAEDEQHPGSFSTQDRLP